MNNKIIKQGQRNKRSATKLNFEWTTFTPF